MDVIGAVDVLDNDEVFGWVCSRAAGPPRYVQVNVDGVEIGSVRADLFRPDLKQKGVSDGLSGFRFRFPVPPDPMTDHAVVVKDRETGQSFGRPNLTIKSWVAQSLGDPNSQVAFDTPYYATNIVSVSPGEAGWRIGTETICQTDDEVSPNSDDASLKIVSQTDTTDTYFRALKLKRVRLDMDVTVYENGTMGEVNALPRAKMNSTFWPVLRLTVPREIPHYMKKFSAENISRVVGPLATPAHFAVTGVNIAKRLDNLLERHFGEGFRARRRVLDWGIGSGRVALPIKHAVNTACEMYGSDVDEYNVFFGQEVFPEIKFVLSPFLPPLPFPDNFFDCIYGISVFTHLTESTQFLWLRELLRICKPGGAVIVSIHGEWSALNTAKARTGILKEVLTYGISDTLMDGNLGPKLKEKNYYRSTFHGLKYVRSRWSEYFDVLAIYPSGNGTTQDFVVMKKPV